MTTWRLLLRRWGARRRTEHVRRTDEAVRALREAADSADASAIAALLSQNATLTIDSGANTVTSQASATPGPSGIARELLSLLDAFPETTLSQRQVNGEAGIVIGSHGRVVGVLAIAVRAGRIIRIWAIVNPDKLTHWNGI